MTSDAPNIKSGNPHLEQRKYLADRRRKSSKCIDLDVLYGLCKIGCTMQEMAGVLGLSEKWLAERRERDPAVADAFERGYCECKESVRRKQMEVALNGSVPMLIWLGKQMLGQRDRHEVETKTEVSILVQNAMEELKHIPTDQLLAARNALRAPVIEAQAEG